MHGQQNIKNEGNSYKNFEFISGMFLVSQCVVPTERERLAGVASCVLTSLIEGTAP
jgi:hypothetical protein